MDRESYQARVKQENIRATLREIWQHSPISRSELAGVLGISKSAITNIVNELMEEGIVQSVGSRQNGPGRASDLLCVNDAFGYIVAVSISTIDTEVAISDYHAHVLYRRVIPTPSDIQKSSLLEQLTDYVREGLQEQEIPLDKVQGIGISVPSMVYASRGFATPIINLYDLPVGEAFFLAFQKPVYVNSLGMNAARAEKWLGNSEKFSSVACLDINRGIGLGLLIDGKVYTGGNGFAGTDVSHMSLLPSGPVCSCGRRGCWEKIGSLQILEGRAMEEVVAEADRGDGGSIEILDRIGIYTGMGIAKIIQIANPNKVVISGAITKGKDWVLNSALSTLKQSIWPNVYETTEIGYTLLTESPPLLGAILSVIETKIG